MARVFKTLSLSLSPGVVEELTMVGNQSDKTGARVAAEIVLREIAKTPGKTLGKRETDRKRSWCCHARVIAVQGQLVLPEDQGKRRWIAATALLCGTCDRQLHGREYEGWIDDAEKRS